MCVCLFIGSSCFETSQLCAPTTFFQRNVWKAPKRKLEWRFFTHTFCRSPTLPIPSLFSGCWFVTPHQDMFNNNTYMSSIYSIAKDQVPVVDWCVRWKLSCQQLTCARMFIPCHPGICRVPLKKNRAPKNVLEKSKIQHMDFKGASDHFEIFLWKYAGKPNSWDALLYLAQPARQAAGCCNTNLMRCQNRMKMGTCFQPFPYPKRGFKGKRKAIVLLFCFE